MITLTAGITGTSRCLAEAFGVLLRAAARRRRRLAAQAAARVGGASKVERAERAVEFCDGTP